MVKENKRKEKKLRKKNEQEETLLRSSIGGYHIRIIIAMSYTVALKLVHDWCQHDL